jgi:hypothetical protein
VKRRLEVELTQLAATIAKRRATSSGAALEASGGKKHRSERKEPPLAPRWSWDERWQVVRGVEPAEDAGGRWVTVVASRVIAGAPEEVVSVLTDDNARPTWDGMLARGSTG